MAEPTVLVTGGSSGIGAAVVARLLEGGRRVAFTYRTGEEAARVIESGSAGRATAFALDLADAARPAQLASEVEAQCGPITALAHCAGVGGGNLLAFTSDAEWASTLDVNLGGAFRCARAVVRSMVRERKGAIVFVASLAALKAVTGQGAYAASKAGVLALTRTLARELGRKGVRANAVVPGFVESPMTAGLDASVVETLRSGECLPGGVAVESVAASVAFLLSDAASSITGQALTIDAGASV